MKVDDRGVYLVVRELINTVHMCMFCALEMLFQLVEIAHVHG